MIFFSISAFIKIIKEIKIDNCYYLIKKIENQDII